MREIGAVSAIGQMVYTERRQPRTRAPSDDREAALARTIRGMLDDYLNGRRLVKVKIRLIEGRKVDGFLKIDGGKGERLLVDFKATATPQGRLSSLQVGGRRISLVGDASKRAH